MAHNYDWAPNKVKLQQSVTALENRAKLDPSIKINEETVREEYISRAGRIFEKTSAQTEARTARGKTKADKEEEAENQE